MEHAGQEDEGTKRRGRWIVEEEEFALKLMELFKRGVLRMAEGVTLRAFLSDRLGCEPMRVTKKMHGQKGMGKRLYRRAESATPAAMDLAELEVEALEARLISKLSDPKANRPGWEGVLGVPLGQAAAGRGGDGGDGGNRVHQPKKQKKTVEFSSMLRQVKTVTAAAFSAETAAAPPASCPKNPVAGAAGKKSRPLPKPSAMPPSKRRSTGKAGKGRRESKPPPPPPPLPPLPPPQRQRQQSGIQTVLQRRDARAGRSGTASCAAVGALWPNTTAGETSDGGVVRGATGGATTAAAADIFSSSSSGINHWQVGVQPVASPNKNPAVQQPLCTPGAAGSSAAGEVQSSAYSWQQDYRVLLPSQGQHRQQGLAAVESGAPAPVFSGFTYGLVDDRGGNSNNTIDTIAGGASEFGGSERETTAAFVAAEAASDAFMPPLQSLTWQQQQQQQQQQPCQQQEYYSDAPGPQNLSAAPPAVTLPVLRVGDRTDETRFNDFAIGYRGDGGGSSFIPRRQEEGEAWWLAADGHPYTKAFPLSATAIAATGTEEALLPRQTAASSYPPSAPWSSTTDLHRNPIPLQTALDYSIALMRHQNDGSLLDTPRPTVSPDLDAVAQFVGSGEGASTEIWDAATRRERSAVGSRVLGPAPEGGFGCDRGKPMAAAAAAAAAAVGAVEEGASPASLEMNDDRLYKVEESLALVGDKAGDAEGSAAVVHVAGGRSMKNSNGTTPASATVSASTSFSPRQDDGSRAAHPGPGTGVVPSAQLPAAPAPPAAAVSVLPLSLPLEAFTPGSDNVSALKARRATDKGLTSDQDTAATTAGFAGMTPSPMEGDKPAPPTSAAAVAVTTLPPAAAENTVHQEIITTHAQAEERASIGEVGGLTDDPGSSCTSGEGGESSGGDGEDELGDARTDGGGRGTCSSPDGDESGNGGDGKGAVAQNGGVPANGSC